MFTLLATYWLQQILSVFSLRIKSRAFLDSLCSRSFIIPNPRSFHSFFSGSNRYNLALTSKRTVSLSSPVTTSTSLSCTTGAKSALHSSCASSASSSCDVDAVGVVVAALKLPNWKPVPTEAAPRPTPAAPKPNAGTLVTGLGAGGSTTGASAVGTGSAARPGITLKSESAMIYEGLGFWGDQRYAWEDCETISVVKNVSEDSVDRCATILEYRLIGCFVNPCFG
mmetsp:Transcript_35588/g.59981  ORF Transcript_35588/g.59981 Transcript_35588/m.59981 type:complete len:225 (+) Transcript_35588:314-988(+)